MKWTEEGSRLWKEEYYVGLAKVMYQRYAHHLGSTTKWEALPPKVRDAIVAMTKDVFIVEGAEWNHRAI